MTHRWLVAGTCVLGFTSYARAGVDPSGHLTQEVGITVPDFHSIAPEIKLRYSSGAGDGFVGVGWSLDVGSRIMRVSATHGVARGDASDVYLLDGMELIPCTATSTSASCASAATAFGSSANYYSTKIESFERIRHDTTLDYFTIERRDGTRLSLFSNDNGNSYDLANVKDTHGNEVHYTQWCDVNFSSCYPDTVTYATAGGSPGASIRFMREPRADKQVFAKSGGFSTLAYRLHGVAVTMDGALVRAYQIHYGQSLSTGASIATTIEQFGRDAIVAGDQYSAGPTPALPPTTMTTASLVTQPTTENLPITAPGLTADVPGTSAYHAHLPLYEDQPFKVEYHTGTYRTDTDESETSERPHGQLTGDFNGDGLTDWVGWAVPGQDCDSIDTSAIVMNKRTHDSVVTGSNTGLLVKAAKYKQCPMQIYVTDLDGDGRDDLLVVSDTGLTSLMSNGGGSFVTGTKQAWSSGADECAVGDFDGDGRGDIACLAAISATNTTVRLSVARSMQGGAWDIQTSDVLGTMGVWPINTNLITAGDFNGDGLTDLTVGQQGYATYLNLLAGTSDGAGHFTWVKQVTAWPFSPMTSTLSSTDVDGDGKSDIVVIERDSSGANSLLVGLAAKGATARFRVSSVAAAPWLRNAQLGDFDGDGKADLMLGDDQSWARGRGDGQFDAPAPSTPAADCAPLEMADYDNFPVIADLNGDGRSDVLCVHDQHEVWFTLSDRMSPNVSIGAHHWIQADVTGDGIPELVFISHDNPGYHVTTVSTADQTRIETDLPKSTELRDEDEPDTDRFIAMDVGSPTGGPDGKTDLVLVDNDLGNVRIYTFLSNGDGTFTLVLSKPGLTGFDSQAWRAASIDNDGLGDLIHPVWTAAGGVHLQVLRSNGDGTWSVATTAANNYFAGSPMLAGRDWFIADVNGDGRSDLVHADGDATGGNSVVRSLLGNGDGTFVEKTSVNMTFFRDIRRVRLADMNGDGLADLVHLAYSGPANSPTITMQTYLSDGTGTWSYHASNVAMVSSSPEMANVLEDLALVRLIDINGDGRSDFVHLSTYIDTSGQPRTALFTANNPGADQPPVWALGLTRGLTFANYDLDPGRWEPWFDRNGDPGLLYVHATQAQAYMFRPSRDRMTELSNGTGGTTTIGYSTLWAARTYLPENSLPVVVTSIEASDTVSGNAETTHYAYGEAQWSNATSMMGFGWTSERDASSIKLTRASLTDQCGPRPTSVQRMSLTAQMFAYTNFAYLDPGAAPFTCAFNVKDDYECDGASCRLARRDQILFDVWGNSIATLAMAAQAPTRFVYRPVIANASSFITNRPAYEAHFDDNKALVSMSRFGYDGKTFDAGPASLGELDTVERFDSTAQVFRTTTLDYDSTGQLVKTTDPRGQSETVAYDKQYGLYPIETCNGKLCKQLTIDPVSGQATGIVDANKATTAMTYDAYGRLTVTHRPSGSETSIQYLDFGVKTQRIRTGVTDHSADGLLWSEASFDGFGRTYRTKREGGATIDTLFQDSSSRPQQVSNTYQSGGTPSGWTSFDYDVLGRVISTSAPDHTMRRTSYLLGQTIGTDQQGHSKTAFTDGNRHVIRIDEHNAGKTATTLYTYDSEGRLVSVVDALGNSTTVEYDALGRKTATVDPDRGRLETTFFENGLVHESHDASGQVIRFDYDQNGRQIRRDDLDASTRVTRTATWQWDTDASGTPSGASMGRLVSTYDSQDSTKITTANVYDLDGHVIDAQRCIDGTCVSTQSSYDIAGRLASITYPAGETVPYAYDNAGNLTSVGSYLLSADYELDGGVDHMTYGNYATTTITYDPMRRWVNTITAVGPRGTIFDATYTYDATGRIHVAQETNPKQTWLGYTYDDLGRLVRVDSSNSARVEHFAYDAISRMLSSGATGDLHYDDTLHVHAPTGADIGYAREYDLNGNTTQLRNPSGHRLGLTWNVDNTLASIDNGKVTDQLAYDTDGARVKRVTDAGTSLYFGSLVEIENGRELHYYYAGDRLIARRDGGDVIYYTRDLTRSTRAVSDASGSAMNHYDYTAFGDAYARSESVAQDQEQGGGRHDDDTDLTYMRARYYDPGLMHFLSADTMVPNIHDPRSLHRYAYTQQDPINFWDPSGHVPLRVQWRKEVLAHSGISEMPVFGTFASYVADAWSMHTEDPPGGQVVDAFDATIERDAIEEARDVFVDDVVSSDLVGAQMETADSTTEALGESIEAEPDDQPAAESSSANTEQSESPEGVGEATLASDAPTATELVTRDSKTKHLFDPVEVGPAAPSLVGLADSFKTLFTTGFTIGGTGAKFSLTGGGLVEPKLTTSHSIFDNSGKTLVGIGQEDPDIISSRRGIGGNGGLQSLTPEPGKTGILVFKLSW